MTVNALYRQQTETGLTEIFVGENERALEERERENIVCISDLDKLNLLWRVDFRLESIFDTVQAPSRKYLSP